MHTREGRVMSLWCHVSSQSHSHLQQHFSVLVFWWMKKLPVLKVFQVAIAWLDSIQTRLSVYPPLKKHILKKATYIILHHSLLAMPVLWRYDADSDRLTDASTLGRYEPSDSESSNECPICTFCLCQSVNVKQSACHILLYLKVGFVFEN